MGIVTDQSEEILATYNLMLIGPPDVPWTFYFGVTPVEGRPIIPRGMLVETEENLTDLLPEGYRVQIKEWDSE